MDAIVERIREELGAPDAPVVATGGLAELIAPHSRTITAVDPERRSRAAARLGAQQRRSDGQRARRLTDSGKRPDRGPRVLVTGGAGFIGSRLCERLLTLGAEVYATWRTAPGPDSEVHWLKADAAEPADARAAVAASRPDVVFHLAAGSRAGASSISSARRYATT